MSAALLCSCIFGIGHNEPEHGAFAHSAVDAEAETVLLENSFGDGEAEAGPLLEVVQFDETSED